MVPPDATPPKWSRQPAPDGATSPLAGRLLLIALCAFALGFATYRFFLQPPSPVSSKTPPQATPAPAAAESTRLVSLFYPLADGSGLSSIIQKRPACPNEAACMEDLLLALSENPGVGLFPLLPLLITPPSISLVGATATINFRRETIQHLPGGVQSERLVLAALVNTLAVNFPQIQQLSIEINGVPAETLKGHIDLSTPFAADFSLVRRALLPSFPVQSGTSSERSP
jgi:hypothetical protein